MTFRLILANIYSNFIPAFISVFRQGDKGKCWYAVMSGTLEVRINQPECDAKVSRVIFPKGIDVSLGKVYTFHGTKNDRNKLE